jgi:GDP-4-dehydro-6-deoxy-D-mannose reductase
LKIALVTGASGFLGQQICAFLKRSFLVVGVDLPSVKPIPQIEWITVKLPDDLHRIILNINPEIVIHAAFINRKPPGLNDNKYIDSVLSVDIPLFKTIAKNNIKLILISSSAVYGNAGGINPINESYPLHPVSIYGFAKKIQESIIQYYAPECVCILRLFNLSGPYQKPGMLLPDWVKMASEIANGKKRFMRVKNRISSRDFVDVRDAARAISLVAAKFPVGEIINVASGKAVSLMDISKELQRICPVPLKFIEEDKNLQYNDVLIQRGSYEKLRLKFDWRPEISWQESLKDLWDSY